MTLSLQNQNIQSRSVLRKDMVPLTVGDRVVITDRRAAMYGMMTNWDRGTLGLTWNEVEEVLSKTNFNSPLHKQIVKFQIRLYLHSPTIGV